ncbi:MAG: TatD family hydrolase [Bacteroidota bacterium]
MIDTHAHLYAEEFDADRDAMLKRCEKANVTKILLPNVDTQSIAGLKQLVNDYPNMCYGMMGLHPCSVTKNYEEELERIRQELFSGFKYWAVGEIGLDLYWDKTTLLEQETAFDIQCQWALELELPIAIHTRSATYETIKCLKKLPKQPGGVFHCFSGSAEEAKEIIKLGYLLGIGGVLTYKNAGLPDVLKDIGLEYLILETDAPYLPPVPFRGKRNESSYLPLIAEKLAEIYQVNASEIADQTTQNAMQLFNLK